MGQTEAESEREGWGVREVVNCRAVIGYGPLIIEFADVMTNRGMGDSYQTSRTERERERENRDPQRTGENLCISLRF